MLAPRIQSVFSQLALLWMIVLLTVVECHAQAPSPAERQRLMAESVKAARSYVDAVRPRLFRDLDPHDRAIYRQISFIVGEEDSGWTVNGGIDEDHQRFVKLDVGYVRQIEMMIAGLLLEQKRGQDFLVPYVRYVASELQKHSTFIKSPYTYIGMSMSEIDTLDRDATFTKTQGAMIANSIAFILAHETAHHILGHYDRPLPPDSMGRQDLERAADQWAIKQLTKANFSPLGGLPPILFDYYLTPFSAPSVAHPAPIQRVHNLFVGMREALPQFRSEIESQGVSYTDFKASIDRQLSEVERQLTAVPTGNEVESSESDVFCSGIKAGIRAGEGRFRALSMDRQPDGESYTARSFVPGAQRCEVWQYRDRSLGSSAVCDFARSYDIQEVNSAYGRLQTSLQACLVGWNSRSLERGATRQLTFSKSDNLTDVRLVMKQSKSQNWYTVTIWFDRE
jgi:hypothetical protein